MAFHLFLIPAVIIGALKVYMMRHAAEITLRAITAAAIEYCKSQDMNKARAAAMSAGANTAAGDLVRDFFR